jgi:hypothetical protein
LEHVSLSELDYLLAPLCIDGHWVLLHFDWEGFRIELHEAGAPLTYSDDSNRVPDQCQSLVAKLNAYLDTLAPTTGPQATRSPLVNLWKFHICRIPSPEDVGEAEARRISAILICARALKITGKKDGKFLDLVTPELVVQFHRHMQLTVDRGNLNM